MLSTPLLTTSAPPPLTKGGERGNILRLTPPYQGGKVASLTRGRERNTLTATDPFDKFPHFSPPDNRFFSIPPMIRIPLYPPDKGYFSIPP